MQIVLFTIEKQQYAMDIRSVRGAVRMVAATPFPDSSPFLLGVINVRGVMVPLLNMRSVFRLPLREVELTDQILLCEKSGKMAALWVDEVVGNRIIDDALVVSTEDLASGWDFIPSAWKDGCDVVFIIDLEGLMNYAKSGHPIR